MGTSKVIRFDVKGTIHKSNIFFFGGRAKKSTSDKNPLFFGKVNLYTGLFLQKDLCFPNNTCVEIVVLGNNIISRQRLNRSIPLGADQGSQYHLRNPQEQHLILAKALFGDWPVQIHAKFANLFE